MTLEDNKYTATYIEKNLPKTKYSLLKTPVAYLPGIDDEEDYEINNDDDDNNFLKKSLTQYQNEILALVDTLALENQTKNVKDNAQHLHQHVVESYPLPKAFFSNNENDNTTTSGNQMKRSHSHETSSSSTRDTVHEYEQQRDGPLDDDLKRTKPNYSSLDHKKIEYAYFKHQQLHMNSVLDNHIVSKQCFINHQHTKTTKKIIETELSQVHKNMKSLNTYQINQLKKAKPILNNLYSEWEHTLVENVQQD